MGRYDRNVFQVNMGVDLWLKRLEPMFVEQYRKIVWMIFMRILRHTPQYSGKAVANWNIGLGAPDYSFDDSLGDERVPSGVKGSWSMPSHVVGDTKWINRAKGRNWPKIAQIQRRTKVYINNAVEGDTDNERTLTPLYLQELQNPAYWVTKLRLANQPYETAHESIIVVVDQRARIYGEELGSGGFDMDGGSPG